MKKILLISLSLLFAGEMEVDGDLKLEGSLIFQDQSTMNTASSIPSGVLFPYVGQSIPEGYLICAGQEVSREQYSTLFEVVGELYGSGDGVTTFNLPDLRGRIPLGRDNMNNLSADRVTSDEADNLGGSAGTEKHQLTIDEMPSHNHSFGLGYGGESNSASKSHNNTSTNTGNTGNSQPHNNMPPYLTLNYIIKF